MTPNVKRLLFVTALILVFKWVLLPIISWQSHKLSELQSQINLINKSNDIIDAQSEMAVNSKKIIEALSINDIMFFSYEGNVKLNIQRELEQILQDKNIFIDGFDWITKTDESEDKPHAMLCRININGSLKNFIDLHASISQNDFYPKFYFKDINIRSDRGNGNIQDFDGYIIVSVLVYSREKNEGAI